MSSPEVFIIGTGAYLPERVIENEELAPLLGLTPEQIFKSSGIARRHWATPGTRTSSLAAFALVAAIEDAKITRDEIDYVIFGTMTPDRFIPGCAPALQHELGLKQIPCLDIRAACCNGLYALQLARSLIISRAATTVAICLAEVQSAWLNLSSAAGTTSMLFGDGASAMIVSGEWRKGAVQVVDVVLTTDGEHTDDLGIRRPGSEFGPAAKNTGEAADFFPRMVGQSVILHASRKMVCACETLLERHGLSVGEIRWLVPHQANANLLSQVARNLKFNLNSVVNVISESGNTSSASMGIALDALRRSCALTEGDYILMPAFGAGFTWGAALCRVKFLDITPGLK
jgi:3-oxoacyl-[acyl-carrier-protein] synthase-3